MRNRTALELVRQQRGLPFLRQGMRVEVDGQMGTVTGGNHSSNIDVRFDGRKYSENCHPTWRTRYFGDDGKVIAEFGD